MDGMRGMGEQVIGLLFPRGCAGCDSPDEVLCASCRRLFECRVSHPLASLLMGRWHACGWYQGSMRHAILSWKDHGDEECDRPFGDALCRLSKTSGTVAYLREHASDLPVLVVPAPSSRASMRRRGRRHMWPVAKRLADYLRAETGLPVVPCEVLASRGVQRKSVQMTGVSQRSQRLKGHVAVLPSVALRERRVILVDDIVTSGATMRRCVEALRREGAEVVTVLTLAHTPKHA